MMSGTLSKVSNWQLATNNLQLATFMSYVLLLFHVALAVDICSTILPLDFLIILADNI